jgi:hypothetical protein
LVDVLWEGRIVMMFAVDVEKRAEVLEDTV